MASSEMKNFFADTGLEKFLDVFVEEGIEDMETLLEVSENDLNEMLPKIGHRTKLRAALDRQRAGVSRPQAAVPKAPALTQEKVDSAQGLTNSLSHVAKAEFLEGVQSMTTDLDQLFVDLREDFLEQLELCEAFRALALKYRPIRNEAVSTVVTLKEFADNAHAMFLPMLQAALDDGNLADTKEVLTNLVSNYKGVHTKLKGLKHLQKNITVEARRISDKAASKAQEHHAIVDNANSQKKDANKGMALGGGGMLYFAAGTLVLGSGPVGWTIAGLAAAGGCAAAGVREHSKQTNEAHLKLMESAQKINAQMNKATAQLEKQCVALEALETVRQLWGCTKSTEASNMDKMQFKLWLEKKFPEQLKDLSKYCRDYLGKESAARVKMLDDMNLSGKQFLEKNHAWFVPSR